MKFEKTEKQVPIATSQDFCLVVCVVKYVQYIRLVFIITRELKMDREYVVTRVCDKIIINFNHFFLDCSEGKKNEV